MTKQFATKHVLKRLFMGAFFIVAIFSYLNNSTDHSNIAQLYNNKQSGVMVEFKGEVLRLLSDDTMGSRHQRFIVKHEDITLLVSHNIDLAHRVPVKKGDIVSIYGQYEWNNQGGVVHWTHDDPQGRHENGWIKLNGESYGEGY